MASSEPVLCQPVVELSRSETRFWQRLVRHGHRGRTHEIDGCTYRFMEFHDEDNTIIAHRLCDATPENPTGDIVVIVPEYTEGHKGSRSVVNYVGTSYCNEVCRHGRGGVVLEHARVSRAMGRLLSHGDGLMLWKDYDQPKKRRARKTEEEKPAGKRWKQMELPVK